MLLLFTDLLRIYHDSPSKIDQPTFTKGVISEILDYMEKNYETIILEKTANYFHFHPNHLTRLLKQNLNKTFIELSHQLKNACTMLENTDFTVDQIAHKTGYAKVSFFL